jgi:hypothetical protein
MGNAHMPGKCSIGDPRPLLFLRRSAHRIGAAPALPEGTGPTGRPDAEEALGILHERVTRQKEGLLFRGTRVRRFSRQAFVYGYLHTYATRRA